MPVLAVKAIIPYTIGNGIKGLPSICPASVCSIEKASFLCIHVIVCEWSSVRVYEWSSVRV
jgi:hypothetical protein